ncbi:YpzG family protein [Siminovitchia sediminis]|uniref:YpzG family protein n=1 Tax=Siminovitchia sediminis TaxID=1274353 RepID=A0ABW4KJU9_9BACI
MHKDRNAHMNRNLTPFNRGWYRPKHEGSQVNGQTQRTQEQIIMEKDAVTKYKR